MSEIITLRSRVETLKGVGDQLAGRLHRLGLRTVRDLIEFLPRRVEDRSQLRRIRDLAPDIPQVISGVIERVSSRISARGAFIVSAKVTDDSGSITALWFNQRYLLKFLKEGDKITLFGEKRLIKTMGIPFFVKKIIDQPEIAPIYRLTSGVTQATIQKLLKQCRFLVERLPDYLPKNILEAAGLPHRAHTLTAAHFTPSEATLASAQSLLGYEELITVCLAAVQAKRERQQQRARVAPISASRLDAIQSQHVFSLTSGQRQVVAEIATDLGQTYPMNRLLYGEVGSGKTAVGLVTSVAVAKQGKRVLWLSPTTTLATQQDRLTKEFCQKFSLRSALVTGAIKEPIAQADIVVGTHALLHSQHISDDVALVVVDEQQRFGVEQRNFLLERYSGCHLLMLSATPIPRTLAHTLFGHIDISYLREKPRHQQPIVTKVFTDANREQIEDHLRKRLAAGQPGYVICPLIDEVLDAGPGLFDEERKAVIGEQKRLQKLFPTARIGLLHGRLKAEEKTKTMEAFRSGQVDILVATSVIEVGIDNPNATWILIEEADRFGLSQLHQLRGRVGRGSAPSVCFLHNSLSTDRAAERLGALASAADGLEIAELDLRLRGPGSIAGTDQSGLPGIRYANLGDTSLVQQAYRQAERIGKEELAAYPDLARAVKRLMRDGLTPT